MASKNSSSSRRAKKWSIIAETFQEGLGTPPSSISTNPKPPAGDTLQMGLPPNIANPEQVPPSCRETVPEWGKEVVKISEEIMDILCEGLGLENGLNKLKELTCLEGRVMAALYYPYCPQPELTAGLTSHTDPGLLTVLVQNEVLVCKSKLGRNGWNVEPVEGAIVIIIGDILQIISNDEYISVEHRVLANPLRESRVSDGVFLKPSLRDQLYIWTFPRTSIS